MSNTWLNRVARSREFRGAARAVLRELADMADEAGRCWPSLATLAQRAGISRRHAMRVLRDLAQGRHICVQVERRRIGAAQNLSNIYTLRLAGAPEETPERPVAIAPAQAGDALAPQVGTSVPQPGDALPPRMETWRPQPGDAASLQSSSNPNTETPLNQQWRLFLQTFRSSRLYEIALQTRVERIGAVLCVYCPAADLPLLAERLGAYARRYFTPEVERVEFVALNASGKE